MLFLIIAFVIILVVFAVIAILQNMIPIQYRKMHLHTFHTRKKLYFIVRYGLSFIVEFATPEDDATIPMPNEKKMQCMIIEGAPFAKGFKLKLADITYMQRKFGEHLAEYYPWIQVTELLMPKT